MHQTHINLINLHRMENIPLAVNNEMDAFFFIINANTQTSAFPHIIEEMSPRQGNSSSYRRISS